MDDFDKIDAMLKGVRVYLDDARDSYQTGPADAPDSIGHVIDAVISLAGAVSLLRRQTEAMHKGDR